MKIFVICSKSFYGEIGPIREQLESEGHTIVLPNCFDKPETEQNYRDMGEEEHSQWKASMIRKSVQTIEDVDAVLVLNFKKNNIENYIGGATFLEIYDAFRLGKKIFFYNDAPKGILYDELVGFSPQIIKGNLSKVK